MSLEAEMQKATLARAQAAEARVRELEEAARRADNAWREDNAHELELALKQLSRLVPANEEAEGGDASSA